VIYPPVALSVDSLIQYLIC